MVLQVGNWSRWLTDTFGMDAAETNKDGHDVDDRRDVAESSCFKLLNELSDLLMLPKDMLLEKSIRKEVSVHMLTMSYIQILFYVLQLTI